MTYKVVAVVVAASCSGLSLSIGGSTVPFSCSSMSLSMPIPTTGSLWSSSSLEDVVVAEVDGGELVRLIEDVVVLSGRSAFMVVFPLLFG